MAALTSTVFKVTKNVVLGLIVLTCVYFVYKTVKSFMAKRKQKTVAAPQEFGPNDIVNFVPKIGQVIDISSDRTADALLSGAYGPVVVVFVAEWCHHCKNMSAALEEAAKSSPVPFVRVDGPKAPVSGQKYAVSGYPTVFGITNVGGGPRRFASMRTTEALLEFARGLSGTQVAQLALEPAAAVAPAHAVAPAVYAAPAAVHAVQPSVHVEQLVAPVVLPSLASDLPSATG